MKKPFLNGTKAKQLRRIVRAAVCATSWGLLASCAATPSVPTKLPSASTEGRLEDLSDAALVKGLPGFANGDAVVNGVHLHYVSGGQGEPLVLLPGWPQTWWAFHKVMPELSHHYRVIAVDLRGMGGSGKPASGYDKKTMAKDVVELTRRLGYAKVHVLGHDIGAQVAFSFAANHHESTRSLIMLDVPHPDDGLAQWPMLPAAGTFGDKLDPKHPYVWWFAFHQVRGLPEDLLEGRANLEQEWFFRYLLRDESAIGPKDRAIYAAAYNSRDAIRAGNAWYQAFPQDIIDDRAYQRLEMPVLGLAGPGYVWLQQVLASKAARAHVVQLENCGHFVQEEQPEETIRLVLAFLRSSHGG